MKSKPLGKLEQQVMDVVWICQNCSVKDVQTKLKSRKLAYTTVATILQRLYNKKLLIRKGEGNKYLYSPKLSKSSYSKNVMQTFLTHFIDSFGEVAIASFAESIEHLPKKKRKYLLKLLEETDKHE